MTLLHAPDVLARGRFRSGDELDAMARAWRAAVLERCGETARPIAAALPASPEAVALFVARTSLPSPVILLPVDTRAWRIDRPIPVGTPIALLPSLAPLAPEADRFGLVPIVLPDPSARPVTGVPLMPLAGAGVVLFTSGSTGPPKPLFHTRSSLLAWAGTRNDALGLARGAVLLGQAPLA